MEQFLSFTLLGFTQGMIYAAIALALVLIWRSTGVLNFAQGAMAMVTTYIALSVLERGGSYLLAFVVALTCGLVLGAVVERVLIRPVEKGPPLNAVIVALGLLVFLEAIIGIIYGGQFKPLPPPFDVRGIEVGGLSTLSRFDLFAIASVAVLALLLAALFRFTALGLRMRAAAFEPEVARLLGVRVGRLLTLGWALAAVAGSLAGLLIPPKGVLLSPTFMDGVFVFGFTGAVIGGLDSTAGAVVGGVGLGLVLTYVGGYLGTDLVALSALGVLVLVLMLRPGGLFSRATARRV